MLTFDKYPHLSDTDVQLFLEEIDFDLDPAFIEFFRETKGAIITTDELYISLLPLTEMIQLNHDYKVSAFAIEYFIFCCDGWGSALP